jgi:hypothetical protein
MEPFDLVGKIQEGFMTFVQAGGVPWVSRWCPGGVPVVSQSGLGGVPVVSRWCPGGFPVVSQWGPGGVPVVCRCLAGVVSVVSQGIFGSRVCPGPLRGYPWPIPGPGAVSGYGSWDRPGYCPGIPDRPGPAPPEPGPRGWPSL